MDERQRPIGGPVLLNEPGVKVVPTCSECGIAVDLSVADHHVCIPVKDGAPRKVTASVARQEYEESLPDKQAAADAEARARPAPLGDA